MSSQKKLLYTVSCLHGWVCTRTWHLCTYLYNVYITCEICLRLFTLYSQNNVNIFSNFHGIYDLLESSEWGFSQSVQFNRSVVSDSLQPHELQHTRPPCPSPTPRVHPNPRPSSQWCHPAISSSVVPFSSCPQSLPGSESFPMSQLFTWGDQSTGVSALASLLQKKSQGWSPSDWTGLISL